MHTNDTLYFQQSCQQEDIVTIKSNIMAHPYKAFKDIKWLQ